MVTTHLEDDPSKSVVSNHGDRVLPQRVYETPSFYGLIEWLINGGDPPSTRGHSLVAFAHSCVGSTPLRNSHKSPYKCISGADFFSSWRGGMVDTICI